MACLPSDLFIGSVEDFRRLLAAAHSLAAEGYLVTAGIQPTGPASGYGYIEQGDSLGVREGVPH